MAKSLRRRLRQVDRAGSLSHAEKTRLILDERTERLAGRSDGRDRQSEETSDVLVCTAGRERYGIPVAAIAEVLPFRTCLPVPDGPPALVGLFGRGGRLVSVIDLGSALGLGTAAETGDRHLVVLRGAALPVALRVDRAEQVVAVTPVAAGEAGSLRHEAVTGHAAIPSGVAAQERILSLLDVDRLLRPYLTNVPVPGA